jgi:hypothetical protein
MIALLLLVSSLDYKSWIMKPLAASNNFLTTMSLNFNLSRLTRTTAMLPNAQSEPLRIILLPASVAPTSFSHESLVLPCPPSQNHAQLATCLTP